MFKKIFIAAMIMIFSLSAVQAQIEKMSVCSGLQFVLKELIAGREQTTLKGKVNRDDATLYDCKMIFAGWQGVGISEPKAGFTITFYSSGDDEKSLRELFEQAKKDILGCALTDVGQTLTIDKPGQIEFTISSVTVMMVLLPKTATYPADLAMRITKKLD